MAKKITKTFVLQREPFFNGDYYLKNSRGYTYRWFCARPFTRFFPNCKLKRGEKRKVKITIELV